MKTQNSLPVREGANKGVGNQLNGGLGGKQQSHLDVLIDEKTGRLWAVAAVWLQRRSDGSCGGPCCAVGGGRSHRVVIQGYDAVEFVLKSELVWGVVLHRC